MASHSPCPPTASAAPSALSTQALLHTRYGTHLELSLRVSVGRLKQNVFGKKRGLGHPKKNPITFPPDFSFAVFQLVMRKLSQNTLFAQFARIFT